MAWIYLLLASLCEIAWATGMKYTGGFSSKPWLSLLTFLVSIVSFVLLAFAMRTLPLGTSYAIWTGLGAAVVGIVLFNEAATAARLLCLAMIIAGIIGLRLTNS